MQKKRKKQKVKLLVCVYWILLHSLLQFRITMSILIMRFNINKRLMLVYSCNREIDKYANK